MPFGELLSILDIVPALVPVNLATGNNNTADTNGVWADMGKYNRLSVVFFKSLSATSEDPVLTFAQALDKDGGSTKALNVTRYWRKSGTVGALIASTTWTAVTQTAASTITLELEAELEALVVVDITGPMLDVAGGFEFVNCTVPDVGSTAQLGAMLYILSEPRNMTATQVSTGI